MLTILPPAPYRGAPARWALRLQTKNETICTSERCQTLTCEIQYAKILEENSYFSDLIRWGDEQQWAMKSGKGIASPGALFKRYTYQI